MAAARLVALILACWALVDAVSLARVYLLNRGGPGISFVTYVLGGLTRPGLRLVGAVLLLVLAPRLAQWLIPRPHRGCPECGYAMGDAARCPECGVDVA